MKKIILEAQNENEAKDICSDEFGWTPEAIREVESGDEVKRAYMCFESQVDAETWGKQI